MDNNEFATAESISKYVKKKIDWYRNDPSKIDFVIEDLKVIFDVGSEYRIKVLDGNDFVVVFRNILGKKRLAKLKILLLQIDANRFSTVTW